MGVADVNQSPALLDNAFVTYANVMFKTKQYSRNALCITKNKVKKKQKKIGKEEAGEEEENIYIKSCNC